MNEDLVYRGRCPKCGTLLYASRRIRLFRWPGKEWDALWRTFDELFKRFDRLIERTFK
jgi:hypothetical protein